MQDVVVLSSNNSLDFHDIRLSVVRIPEVMNRIFEAQSIWDECDQTSFNLYNYLISDDANFLSNIRLKSLASAVVQVGLYDRYIKRSSKPRFLLGNKTGDSALNVCAGLLSFKDMITGSEALKVKRPDSPLGVAGTVLSGVTLDEVEVLEFKDVDGELNFHKVDDLKAVKTEELTLELVEEYSVQRVINVGPGFEMMSQLGTTLEMKDVQLMESIDMDPMLSWFWGELHRQEPMLMAQ